MKKKRRTPRKITRSKILRRKLKHPAIGSMELRMRCAEAAYEQSKLHINQLATALNGIQKQLSVRIHPDPRLIEAFDFRLRAVESILMRLGKMQ